MACITCGDAETEMFTFEGEADEYCEDCYLTERFERQPRHVQIANVIAAQIPGMVKMSVGAREFLASEAVIMHRTRALPGLRFRVGIGAPKRFVAIGLDEGRDTYVVEYMKVVGIGNVSVEERMEDVYCDMLGEVIERMHNASHERV